MPSKPRYDEDFKKQIIKLNIQDGMTLVALEKEYSVSKATISNWVKRYRKECQQSSQAKDDLSIMERNRQLNREIDELKKEIAFLKKATAFFAKEIE